MYRDITLTKEYFQLNKYIMLLKNHHCAIVDFLSEYHNPSLMTSRGKRAYEAVDLDKWWELKKASRVTFLLNERKKKLKKKLKKELSLFLVQLKRIKISKKRKKFLSFLYLRFLKIYIKHRLVVLSKKKRQDLKIFKISYKPHYNYINYNVNLNAFFKNNKLLKILLNKLLKRQVFLNSHLFNIFLGLNLNLNFLKRFKFRFLLSIKKIKSKFNYNNVHTNVIFKILFKITNYSHLYICFSRIKKVSTFYYLLYKRVKLKLHNLVNLNISSKYLNKFKNYLINLKNIDYIKLSFNLFIIKRKNRRKLKKYLKKNSKINLFLFFRLAISKLIIFLFLYWFNRFINKSSIKFIEYRLLNWFKPIFYIFKSYIWRKKRRLYYLQYNEMNKFIFLNYKNKLVEFI